MAIPPKRRGDQLRDHLFLSNYSVDHSYTSPNQSRSRIPDRVLATHADVLRRDLSVIREGLANVSEEIIPGFASDSTSLEIVAGIDADLPDLEKKTHGIRVGNVHFKDDGTEVATIVLPRESIDYFDDAIEKFATELTRFGNPAMRSLVAPIEHIRLATIDDFWTDPRPLPADQSECWWECWCWVDRVEELVRAANALNLRLSDQHIRFPEMTVVPLYGKRADMESILIAIDAIGELRYAKDSPHFYTHEQRENQLDWVESLTDRILIPEDYAPYICLLDSGVNREHPLIAPMLESNDMYAYDSAWQVDDNRDHGTPMAGLALYGNLENHLSSTEPVQLTHRLESVKIEPPHGFDPNEPQNYGSITQGAIALPEINHPSRNRTFCLSITNRDVSGERASSWSAALDQSAAGCAIGDEVDETDQFSPTHKRLILVSAGNVPDYASYSDLLDPDEFPIEDPAQAWNVLSVGGFTDKVDIQEKGYESFTAIAGVGDVSPYSRASTDWPHSTTPIKPELVFEAGNRAVDAYENEIASGLASLSLLSTGANVVDEPLAEFWATSAAVAQAAHLAGSIRARYPEASPELVRALMVHSAEWSPSMLDELNSLNQTERKNLLRRFGYGIPDFARAIDSANNDLALVVEESMRPYRAGRSFNVAQFYELPWPTATLQELGNEPVQMKVTLSYFIEPNPGQISPLSSIYYRSCGLRFVNKRAGETVSQFEHRVNVADRGDLSGPGAGSDAGWFIGSKHISSGSLHSDVWNGAAIELADRKHIAIVPVMGWWRERPALRRYESEVFYALVVSLSTADHEVDLYSEIQSEIVAKSEIEI